MEEAFWCWMRESMEENSRIMGWYFLSLLLSTFEFWKCSIRLPSPCSLAYVSSQIYIATPLPFRF
jgi:hypothetical protein